MNYNLINNLTEESNHVAKMKELFQVSNEVILVSPFLMPDFSGFFNNLPLSNVEKVHLITTLKPKSLEQLSKIKSLDSFVDHIKRERINYEISLINNLHAKIYIFKNSNGYVSAIITSANLTNRGLSSNNEWGVEIKDQNKILELENLIIGSLEYKDISHNDIRRMKTVAQSYKEINFGNRDIEIELNLTELIEEDWFNKLGEDVEFWLKPIGVSDDPIKEGQVFDKDIMKHHFSKKRPNSVRVNDILIVYGVGVSKVLSIYKVVSTPRKFTPEEEWLERWPWYVEGKNLTPKFGSQWWKSNFRINNLKDQFLLEAPNSSVTKVGGKTLGALQFGHDKLRISKDFASFIIKKVLMINDAKQKTS